MEDKTNLVRIYTGSELTVNLLKSELEKVGITAMSQSDTGVSSGFYGNSPSEYDLLIQDEDMPLAEPILKDFIALNR